MLDSIAASGVVFTRSLSFGAPYYIVNYDNTSGSAESITSGMSRDHKTLFVRRDSDENSARIPTFLSPVISATREIEELLSYDSLDIEFAITSDGVLNILQVRPIAVQHRGRKYFDEQYLEVIDGAIKNFKKLQAPSPAIAGNRTIFGVMPDWNPAEIIGTKPTTLALSLYNDLVMKQIWAQQRAEYGYRDVRWKRLLECFCGTPYVDVRASFNSFIPQSIDDDLAAKLTDFYIERLIRNPDLHDKVEFEIVPTVLTLDFSRWQEIFMADGGFTANEVTTLREALAELTQNALYRNAKDFASIEALEERFAKILNVDLDPFDTVFSLLDDAKRLGTLPFAHLARSAFVAMALLKSGLYWRNN